jgi:pimeloyl-ACP methyl ester carboxylesterase
LKLLLLPGMDGTGLMFEPLLKALPGWLQPTVVAYPVHEPLDYEGLLPAVRAACPSTGEFVVLAESFSGPLAVMLAASEPLGLRGVILCASFIRCPLRTPFRWIAAAARPVYFRLVPTWLARWALFGGHGTDRLHRLFATATSTVSPAAMAARARAVASVDVTAELRMCPVPLLYLQAQQDRVVGPSCLRAIRREKPEIQVVELPGPHLLLQALPIESAYEVGQFIQRILPGSDTASERIG